MKYQETLNTRLSNGKRVELYCTCSIVSSELTEFTVGIYGGTKLNDCELEECNNIARNWAEEIEHGQTA
jgi:hypothetical protein